MALAAPQFLLLLPLWALLGWRFPRLGIFRPLRLLLLLLVTLLFCQPHLASKNGGSDLWVLLDRSESARDLVDSGESEWRSLLERSRPGRRDLWHVVNYADEVSVSESGDTAGYVGERGRTRTALAVEEALAQMDPGRRHRLLLFTDGYSTEPLGDLGEKLAAAGVPLDYRLVRSPDLVDFQVGAVELPERVRLGEPFSVDLEVVGRQGDAKVPIEIFRGESRIYEGEVSVEKGRGRFRFSDRLASPGAHSYRFQILPREDAYPGNNGRERWVEVVAGPRLLLVTAYPDDPMAAVLRAQGFEVATVTDAARLQPGMLTGARGLILNNVPAYELPNDFIGSIPFFVKEQGGGLVMVGGHRSFGSGGYYESAVDELLPVSMELKSEHRKLGVAMAIVMDRSGSMAVTTPSGHTKMQLANEGAARSIELLGEMDAVTVFAVDSVAHEIAPLTNVGKSRGELISRVRRVESMGGGIFVHEGMSKAWEVLKKAPLGQRHMILFSDVNDSEEPGDYKKLIAEMRAQGTTISVIGMGTRTGADAKLLEDIATLGGGRIFFSEIPGELPNIFAQETVAVARSSFIEETTGAKSSGRWLEIARRDAKWMPEVDGYNLSYLREGDEVALVTQDEYLAPLVAFGRRGIGRTAAVSFPLGGKFSDKARTWPQYGDFVQTLTRWIMGDESPAGIGTRHRLDGTTWTMDLIYEAEPWEARFAVNAPRVILQSGYRDGERRELTWERLAPGHYSVSTTLDGTVPTRAAIQVGDAAISLGPVVAGSGVEWDFDTMRIEELREVSRSSGGEELLDLTRAWRSFPDAAMEPLFSPLLIAILTLFLLEALVTRAGWRMPVRRLPVRSKVKASRPKPVVAPAPAPAVDSPAPPPATETASPDSDQEARTSRYRRAKKGL